MEREPLAQLAGRIEAHHGVVQAAGGGAGAVLVPDNVGDGGAVVGEACQQLPVVAPEVGGAVVAPGGQDVARQLKMK